MARFERGDVIKVPFPYTDRATRQSRPALVVSSVIRTAKIATIEMTDATRLGNIRADVLRKVATRLRRTLGLRD